jgi:hyperosmotically inducible protein
MLQTFNKTGVTRMKKFALATATATALTLAMANAAFAQATQAPMTLAAGEMTKAKESTSDTWITTKVKADLLTEKGIPGSDIKVETNKGVVSLSSDVAISDSQKATAVAITKKIKGVTAVSADGLMAGGSAKADNIDKSKEATSDTWITTKVKADLVTEKGIPGTDIKVETNKGVVSLSSANPVTESQKATAVAITKKIKGVKAVSADGLKAE